MARRRDRRLLVWLFTLFAGINLALGLCLSLAEPRRAGDVLTILEWCRSWLYDGGQLYHSVLPPDYPPNAIVTYALLATIPTVSFIPIWAAVSVALTPLLPGVVRAASPHRRGFLPVSPTILFLCWGGVRAVLQFSLLSLLLAFTAVAVPMHWVVGGVLLALALAKPHIAGPLFLWTVCRRRFGMAIVAAIGVTLEYLIYCQRAGAALMAPMTGWLTALRDTYVGPDALNGYTSLRPWALAAIGEQSAADRVWIVVAVILLLVICVAAVRDRTNSLAVPGLLCLWSLLTIYHNLNNLILMLPAFLFLLEADDSDTRIMRWGMAAIIEITLMLDVPVRLSGLPIGRAAGLFAHADRLLVLSTFAVVSWCWWSLQRLPLAPESLRSRECQTA